VCRRAGLEKAVTVLCPGKEALWEKVVELAGIVMQMQSEPVQAQCCL